MNYRPLDSLKPLAAQLAGLIASRDRDQDRIHELLKTMGLLAGGKTKEKIGIKPWQDASARIGIWKKKVEGRKIIYQRDAAHIGDWSQWAATDVLYPKGNKKRVVLLGESVARGYFYDPHYNVAKELEAILNGIPEGADTEVIDLAKTSLAFAELLELSSSSIALEPDMVILFAGNNWSAKILTSLLDHSYNSLLELFREPGLKTINGILEKRAGLMISELFSTIKDNFVKRGIPVLFIIPEFNLKDWKSDDKENALAWLPEGHTEKWIEAKENALSAIKVNDKDRLGWASKQMVAMSPSNPMSHELLGLFHCLNGDYEQARACFGRSRDAVLLGATESRPRCFKVIRDQLLHQAGEAGIEILDMASVFACTYPGHVPDRQEFLDYCHLTVEGIKTAMHYTAQKVIGMLHKQRIEIDQIPASGLFPENHAAAIAHFCAAIHNAHNGQPSEILHYHCKKAIQYSSKIGEVMLKFVDFSTRRASSEFCTSYAELIFGGAMYQYEGGRSLMHAPGKKLMDISLVDAIVATLGPLTDGIRTTVDQLRKSEHGITAQGTDLLESFYSRTHYNRYIDESDSGLYQARTLESDFYFVLEKRSDPLKFEISCRLPEAGASKRMIGIQLNDGDQLIANLPTSTDWITHAFKVKEEYLMDGVNKLSIKWPFVPRAIANYSPATYDSVVKSIFPVIGEISSFVVRL